MNYKAAPPINQRFDNAYHFFKGTIHSIHSLLRTYIPLIMIKYMTA